MASFRDKPAHAKVRLVEIDENADGQRLDNFLLAQFRGVPRSVNYRVIRKGEVRVNGGRANARRRLEAGDTVRLPPVRTRGEKWPVKVSRTVEEMLEQTLFEDEHLIVLDKPSGLAVHGGTGVEFGLIEQLRKARPELKFAELAHRLDRETSGCLVVAKSRKILTALHASLRGDDVRVEKHYAALIKGNFDGSSKLVDDPVGDRDARSVFNRVEGFDGATLVDIELLTGRNHQARIHAAGLGHPVAGDDRHGDRAFNRSLRKHRLRRLFLHASRLGFIHPGTEQTLTVSAPLPEKLESVLDSVRESGVTVSD